MPEFHQAKSHPSRDLSLPRCIRSARPWADPSAAGGYDLSRSPQVRPPTRIYWELVTTPNARPHPRESDLAGLGRGLGTCILYLHQDHLPHPYPKFLSNYHTPSQTSNYCCFFNFLFKNKYRSTRNCKTDRTPNVTTVLNSCYGISGNVNIQSDTNIEYFPLCFIPMVSYHTQFGTLLLWTGCFSFPKLIC